MRDLEAVDRSESAMEALSDGLIPSSSSSSDVSPRVDDGGRRTILSEGVLGKRKSRITVEGKKALLVFF